MFFSRMGMAIFEVLQRAAPIHFIVEREKKGLQLFSVARKAQSVSVPSPKHTNVKTCSDPSDFLRLKL